MIYVILLDRIWLTDGTNKWQTNSLLRINKEEKIFIEEFIVSQEILLLQIKQSTKLESNFI